MMWGYPQGQGQSGWDIGHRICERDVQIAKHLENAHAEVTGNDKELAKESESACERGLEMGHPILLLSRKK
jgi:hypothetical protein